jgi:hypothetical protein
MLGTKMLKSEFDQDKYIELAKWCNSHEYKTIEDKGDYYEIVDCTPSEDELKANKKGRLLQQLTEVNAKIQELDVASLCDNGDDTTNVIIDGEFKTLTADELDEYHTNTMIERANILQKIKGLN